MARAKYILFIISVSVSVYAAPQIEQPLDWQSRLNIEHELVGKIWSSYSSWSIKRKKNLFRYLNIRLIILSIMECDLKVLVYLYTPFQKR